MATVNFSVPLDVKTAFNREFRGQNKSAVLTNLLRQAVEEQRRRRRRAKAIDGLLALRGKAPRLTGRAIRDARVIGRP